MATSLLDGERASCQRAKHLLASEKGSCTAATTFLDAAMLLERRANASRSVAHRLNEAHASSGGSAARGVGAQTLFGSAAAVLIERANIDGSRVAGLRSKEGLFRQSGRTALQRREVDEQDCPRSLPPQNAAGQDCRKRRRAGKAAWQD